MRIHIFLFIRYVTNKKSLVVLMDLVCGNTWRNSGLFYRNTLFFANILLLFRSFTSFFNSFFWYSKAVI